MWREDAICMEVFISVGDMMVDCIVRIKLKRYSQKSG